MSEDGNYSPGDVKLPDYPNASEHSQYSQLNKPSKNYDPDVEGKRPNYFQRLCSLRPDPGWIPRLVVIAPVLLAGAAILTMAYGVLPKADLRRECEAFAEDRFGDGLYPFNYYERKKWHSFLEEELDMEIARRPSIEQLEMFHEYAGENGWSQADGV